MQWNVELSREVEKWYLGLSNFGSAEADVALERLRQRGNQLGMPHSRSLSKGLFELRFQCEGNAVRVTYIFDVRRRVVTLTQFKKQKNNEQKEILRARKRQKLVMLSRKGAIDHDENAN